MGYTLDQLLDETGVTKLAGRSSAKAPEKFNFSKLASRCRKAAEATPEEQASSDQQGLAEKTAQVEIIRHTMAEIDSILAAAPGVEKTAAPKTRSRGVEDFIKAALDQGHSAESIAAFLQKEGGILDRAMGRVQEFRAGRTLNKARKLTSKGEATGEKATRMWQDRIRNASTLGEKERNALVSRVRIELNDEQAAGLLHGNPAFQNLPAARGLKKPVDKAVGDKPSHAVGVNVGGMKAGLSGEQMQKLKTPALAVGAGYLGHKALSRPEESSGNKKKGVVIINS